MKHFAFFKKKKYIPSANSLNSFPDGGKKNAFQDFDLETLKYIVNKTSLITIGRRYYMNSLL